MRRGLDPDLIVRFPDGFHGAIAMSWTDYGSATDPFMIKLAEQTSAPLLAIEGLIKASQLVTQLKRAQRSKNTNNRAADTNNKGDYA